MSIPSSVICILLCITSVWSSNEQQSENDTMCTINGGVLSVKDELMIIATIGRGISRTTIEIEQYIKETIVAKKLDQYIDKEISYTSVNIATSQYHNQVFQMNNIDKKYLIQLFTEAHNALIYYSNSIDDLLNLNGVFAEETDNRFKKIQDNIKYEMICRYRNVLDVYSQTWKSINQPNDRIQFSQFHRLSPSVIHDVRSIVIVRYLRKWMEDINDVIINLEKKFN